MHVPGSLVFFMAVVASASAMEPSGTVPGNQQSCSGPDLTCYDDPSASRLCKYDWWTGEDFHGCCQRTCSPSGNSYYQICSQTVGKCVVGDFLASLFCQTYGRGSRLEECCRGVCSRDPPGDSCSSIGFYSCNGKDGECKGQLSAEVFRHCCQNTCEPVNFPLTCDNTGAKCYEKADGDKCNGIESFLERQMCCISACKSPR
uniref:Uncharacterized protein n=1 Tax=Peronospora matthiolae TaxID=2874970 RepID=A0AAV1U533_9STRA